MASVIPHSKYSLEEYVRLERYSNVRHEFLDGQIYAMAGGTPEHGLYAANVIRLLGLQLAGRRCRVHTSDVRIRVQATGLVSYPDVSIVCGQVERDAGDRDAVVNPVVLVEVTSRSTEEYDRGEKLEHYKQVPALRAVVFVAHDALRLDVVRRREDGDWAVVSAVSGGTLHLEAIGCELAVDEVYKDPLA
jgi:Uma2 family endonuclease